MNFTEKLLKASQKNRSLLCVGLDPDSRFIPDTDVLEFLLQIVEATKDLVCAYKPNLAFFEVLGSRGFTILEKTLQHIPEDIPVIADAKRGDIGNTARKYAEALFEVFNFDAATVNPYLGYDSLEPFINYAQKGIFILCSTSNVGAADFQQLRYHEPLSKKTRSLFELVAIKAKEWNTYNNIGLVVGATQPKTLKVVRELCPEMPLLIPGIGAQKGDLASAVRYGVDANKEKAIISSSRQILYSARGKDFASAARREALKIREQINQVLANL